MQPTGYPWALPFGKRLFARLLVVSPIVAVLGIAVPCRLYAANGPTISTQPQNQSALVGSNAVFTVVAGGQAPFTYQWSFGSVNLTNSIHISGATNATLTVSNVVTADAGTNYQVVVSNMHGSITSTNAMLTVLVPAAITLQPTNQVSQLSSNVVFSATATGTGPLTWRWQENGTNLTDSGRISGSASSILTISNIQMNDIGGYRAVVSNAYGTNTSTSAGLGVVPLVTWGVFSPLYSNIPWSATNALAGSVGYSHFLALLNGGTVAAWGDFDNGITDYGPVTIPAGLTNAVAVAASSDFDLALRADGSILGWGTNDSGQLDVPAGLTNTVAIAAGFSFSLALENNGTVAAWGDNSSGQTNIPAGLSNVIAIATGPSDSLALLNNGTVVGWGQNLYGDTTPPAGLSNVVAIAAGDVFSLALENNGTVVAWGYDGDGETDVPIGLSNVVAIAAGNDHSVALQNNGTVVAWGFGGEGETNVPAQSSNTVAIAAGELDSVALVQNPVTRVPPTIWWQGPTNYTITIGQPAVFNSTVQGSLPMSFQWFFNGAPLVGQTNQWLALDSLQTNQAGNYSFIVSNNFGSATSAVAALTVVLPPTIIGQPASESVTVSNTASFTVSATGTAPLNYAWYFNGTPLTDGNGVTGSATTNLVLSNLQTNEGGSYQCIVANNYGSATSAVATLTLFFPPFNISIPSTQYVEVGNTAYFTVSASGTPPMHFQWQFNGTNLTDNGHYSGADDSGWTGETFTIANVGTSDTGTYDVIFTNQYGQATSGPVVLNVGYPPLGSIYPATLSVPLNGTATFNADFVSGQGPFTCQWQFNGVNIAPSSRVSSTNDPLVISPVLASDAGSYSCIVSNAYGVVDIGNVYNSPGVLTVLLPPSITTQPQGQSVVAGTNVTFSLSATSPNGSISYQWYFNSNGIPGAQAASLTFTNVQDTNVGYYYAILNNEGGSVTSSVVPLTVQESAPWFINPLQSQNVHIGQNVVLDPTARGSDPLSFQWQLNGTNLPGVTSSTLSILNAQTNNSGAYQVIVTNIYGSTTSAVATVVVQNPVQITSQPASQDALLGGNVSFTVTATGTAPNYQWYFSGAPLSDGGRITGSATATLNIANVQSTDAGGYVVVVSNLLSSATSHTASLTPQAALGSSVRYVMVTSTNPLSPYLDWSTAATNIQDAIDSAVPGDSVVVSNGLYNYGGRTVYGTVVSNRVVLNKPVSVQSLNGPAATTIAGFNINPAVFRLGRCVYLTNGAFLSGFTLTSGSVATSSTNDLIHERSGGGVWCEGPGAVISNCLISVNVANGYGGGAFGGTLINCILTNNTGGSGGGAASNVLLNCLLQKNICSGQSYGTVGNGPGGGTYYSTLSNCVLAANSGNFGAGADGGVLLNCVLTNNSGAYGGGAASNVLYNCILAYNSANEGGGGAYNSALYNCTVVSNASSTVGGAGINGGAAANCIIYYNGSTYNNNVGNSKSVAYTCTVPVFTTPGCITNPPLFVNLAASNFHLQPNSPCINSGNNAYVSMTNDLDGNPRIVGGTVDMGAYEYQTPTSVISYAYLQQYGLPTDGSVDFANLDGTGFNLYQDWVAGLNPTNPASILAMHTPAATINTNGITVTWQSVSGIPYLLQRSTNLQVFTTIQNSIAGHTGTTSYSDTTATNNVPYFYRVGVIAP